MDSTFLCPVIHIAMDWFHEASIDFMDFPPAMFWGHHSGKLHSDGGEISIPMMNIIINMCNNNGNTT